nr:ATP-binding protein [uncultured Acetatifactor sp.]
MQQGGLIGIRNFRQGDDIVFEISDNGRGLSGEKDSDAASSKTGGYGLYNINERLTRHFGADYGLRITDNPGGGTLVVLRIKYRREDNSVR